MGEASVSCRRRKTDDGGEASLTVFVSFVSFVSFTGELTNATNELARNRCGEPMDQRRAFP